MTIKQSPRIETVIRARPGRELSGRQKIKLRYQEHLRKGGHDFLGKSKGPSNELELKSPSADESRVDESVRDQLIDVDRPSEIIAMVWDTTASNTGVHKGSATKFEESLQRAILWVACRHHIGELHIKHANIAVRGATTGMSITLITLKLF